MTKEAGVWIDHNHAVIVMNLDQEEEIKQITSDVEKHVRYSGGGSESYTGGTEDSRDNRFNEKLKRYYNEVISYLRDATSILILGPGEAKVELQKSLEEHKLSDRIVAVETTDKMTDPQIAAEVRRQFKALQHGSLGTTQQ